MAANLKGIDARLQHAGRKSAAPISDAFETVVRPCLTVTCTLGAALEAWTVDAPSSSTAKTKERNRYVTGAERISSRKPLAKLKERAALSAGVRCSTVLVPRWRRCVSGMLRFPRNLSIQRKVTFVVLVTSTACLLVACVALFAFQLLSFRRNFVADLASLSDVVANSAISSVAFDDREAANAVLSGLKAKPHVRSASIVKQGEIFALFGEGDDLPKLERYPKEIGYRFDGNALLYRNEILFDDEAIATLYIRSDYGAVYFPLLKLYARSSPAC